MLTILGIVAIIVITIQVYKTASGTGRNAGGWATASALVGIGIQFVFPICVGIAYGIYLAATQSPTDNINDGFFGFLTILSLVSIAVSIGGMLVIANHVGKVPDEPTDTAPPPPPPPRFDQPS